MKRLFLAATLASLALTAVFALQFLAGDPDMLIEQIDGQRKATGAGVLVFRNEVGPVDVNQALEGLELFAREVLPVVHKL